jgi:hypothetical protein
MKQLSWMLVVAIAAGLGYWGWRVRRKLNERRLASEERMAQLLAQAVRPAAAPAGMPDPGALAALAQQRLLLDAAAKAAEAGEPALAIQLYARLIARYPAAPSAAMARTAAEAQKRKLSLSKSPDTSCPG